MKPILIFATAFLLFSSCNRPSKELATVEIGMSKTEVIGIVGEPNKKNVVNKTEIWDYPDSNRTVVFRMDTVYAVMTSARARLDSVNTWMDSTNTKFKKGFGKIGEKLEDVGDKIEGKVKRDSINR